MAARPRRVDPHFVAPLFDASMATAVVFGVLVLSNLAAGLERTGTAPRVVIPVTTAVGFVVVLLGPAVVLIAENLRG